MIATGRRAREWPNLPDLGGFHMVRSLDDTHALRAAVKPGGKAAIVGAGFIGCEVAATLRGLGVDEVTLIDIAPHPMLPLGPEIGARAAKLHEDHGVRLRMSTSVASFEGRDHVEAVVLEDGERVQADFVLLALGSVPNSEWLVDSGLTLHKGTVVCDEYCMAVGVEGVAAAGDVAAYPHRGADGPIWIEHWSNARDMGASAAANLLRPGDEREPFVAVPTFWSDQYDVKIKSAGLLSLADSFTVIEEDPERPVAGRGGASRRRAGRRGRVQPQPHDHRLPAPARRSAGGVNLQSFNASTSSSLRPQARRASAGAIAPLAIAPGVRLKRGAGAGCVIPSCSTNVERATTCGCGRRLGEAQDRRRACLGRLEHRRPLVAGAGGEQRREAVLELGPAGLVPLRHLARVDLEQRHQRRVELRLDRADRDVAAVGGLVDLVEVGARIEHVGARLVVPDPAGAQPVEDRRQDRGAVDHRGVDDLALAGARAPRAAPQTTPNASSMPPPP